MFTRNDIDYEYLIRVLTEYDLAPRDLYLNEILDDDLHPFWSYMTRLYGSLSMGKEIELAGGDVSYLVMDTISDGRLIVKLFTSVGIVTEVATVSINQLLVDWLVAYKDEGNFRVRQ